MTYGADRSRMGLLPVTTVVELVGVGSTSCSPDHRRDNVSQTGGLSSALNLPESSSSKSKEAKVVSGESLGARAPSVETNSEAVLWSPE